MTALAYARKRRTEFILDHCHDLDAYTLTQELWRRFKDDVSTNAVNSIIYRAKKAGDRRVSKRPGSKGWNRDRTPFNRAIGAKKRTGGSKPGLPMIADLAETDLPYTARLLIDANTKQKNCKYPLRGSGIGLIVCGADTGGRPPYCPTCRAKTVLAERPK